MLAKTLEGALDFLRGRKSAYMKVFSRTDLASQMVLRDLYIFCRANESCMIPGDDHRTFALEGRREVWLRIQQHIGLSPEELLNLYNGKGIPQ